MREKKFLSREWDSVPHLDVQQHQELQTLPPGDREIMKAGFAKDNWEKERQMLGIPEQWWKDSAELRHAELAAENMLFEQGAPYYSV